MWMFRSQRLLPDGQRPFVQRLCLGILALVIVKPGQVVEARGDIAVPDVSIKKPVPSISFVFSSFLNSGLRSIIIGTPTPYLFGL